MKSFIQKCVVVVLIITSSTFGSVSVSYAHNDRNGVATPGNDSEPETSRTILHAGAWQTNGCTVVPDHIRGVFYFNHPCDHHDGCYGGHWKSRFGCDNQFWGNMEASCRYSWSWWNPARAACRSVRNTYYAGVRTLGYPAYNGWSISGPSGW